MDAIEKAIRAAFEKGNAEDRAFREKVYRSAFAALDRAMQAHPNLTVEHAINRRKQLQATIAEIESEFVPAAATRHEPLASPEPDVEREPAVVPEVFAAGDANIEPVPTVEMDIQSPGGSVGPGPSVGIEPSFGPEPTVAPRVVAAPEPSVSAPDVRVAAPSVAPAVDTGRETIAAPALDMAAERQPPQLAGDDNAVAAADADVRRNERRRPYAAVFLGITVFAAAAIGGWWAYQAIRMNSAAELQSEQPPAPPTVEEDFDPGNGSEGAPPPLPGQADQRNWLTVFSPSDPSVVNAPSGASAEVQEDDTGSFLRVRSGANGAAVVFDVGQGVLEQVAGKKAVFDVIARAEEGKETEMSIECAFGDLGDCGRKRYAVGYERGEFLFDVTFPQKQPGAAGSIAINSDFANQGKAVDIYEIRVAIEP